MPSTDTDPKNVGYEAAARLFVTDLDSNTRMRTDWSTMLSQIATALAAAKSKAEKDALFTEAVQACDNFLVSHGYRTTAECVLDLIKSPFWEDHVKASQPNKDSDRFVQKLLTDAATFKAWSSLLLQVNDGSKSNDDLDAYLKANDYNCTVIQVNASFVKLRNHQLTYWSGTYDTYIQQLDGDGNPAKGTSVQQGPTLIIQGPDTVQLVGPDSSKDLVRKLNATGTDDISAKTDQGKYVYGNGKLVWEAGPSTMGVSVYGGSVVFSEITLPTQDSTYTGKFAKPTQASSYTGPVFDGTLTSVDAGTFDPFSDKPPKVTTYKVTGQLAPDPNSPAHAEMVPAHDPTLREQIAKWVGYALIGFMILKTVWSMGKKYTTTKEFQKDSDVFDDQISRAETEGGALEKEIAGDQRSPYEELDFSDSNVLQDLREQVAEAKTEGAQAEAEAQARLTEAEQAESEFDDLPAEEAEVGGDGWGGDIGEIPFPEL